MEDDLVQQGLEPQAANLQSPSPASTSQLSPDASQQDPGKRPIQRATKQDLEVKNQLLGKGSLVLFKYENWKHDPYPLVLVSRRYADGRIAGINLHYLTFRYIKNLLNRYSSSRSFDYQMIKGDKYISNAYRSYEFAKMKQAKILDSKFLLDVLGSIRSYNPSEIEKMRKDVQQRLRQQVNPSAEELIERIPPTRSEYGLPKDHWADGRRNPNLQTPGSGTVPAQPATVSGQPATT